MTTKSPKNIENLSQAEFLDLASTIRATQNQSPRIVPAFNSEMIHAFIYQHLSEFKKFCSHRAIGPTSAMDIMANLRGEVRL